MAGLFNGDAMADSASLKYVSELNAIEMGCSVPSFHWNRSATLWHEWSLKNPQSLSPKIHIFTAKLIGNVLSVAS